MTKRSGTEVSNLKVKIPKGYESIFETQRKDIFFYEAKGPYDGCEWKSTEHYYQAQKFMGDNENYNAKEYALLIRDQNTPFKAAVLARQRIEGGYSWRIELNEIITKYSKLGVKVRADWEQEKENVMEKALMAKFTQNEFLKQKLISTGEASLVEHTRRDSYWGDGGNGTGKNRLGFLLCKVREALNNEKILQNVSQTLNRVAVIGSSGRGECLKLVTFALFEAMVEKAIHIIEHTWKLKWHNVQLISGAASFSDHVAVELFSRFREQGCRLILHFPCAWTGKSFSKDCETGKVSNYHHANFSKKLGIDSLLQISSALESGAESTIGNGFHKRDNLIASQCHKMIAFSDSLGLEPINGGTAYTWSKCKSSQKIHIPLQNLNKIASVEDEN